jgi:predicted HTH domain antitoxin
MTIGIEIPEEIGRQLARSWGDLPTRAREAVAIEGYRSGALSQAQLQLLLGLASRWETDDLLKRAGVYLDYTEADLERDLETSRSKPIQ